VRESPLNVGGQAIIEGVMMRSPHSFAMAVRRPNGEIAVREEAWHSIWERARWLRRPGLRGAVVLVESLWNGISALSFSANEAARAEAEATAAEGESQGDELSSLAIGGTILLALVLGFGLFAALPHLLTWLMGLATGNAALASGRDLGFQIVDGIVKIAVFLAYLALISRMRDIRRVFEYHGAEHKGIACYEAGAALTVANARGFPRLHPRCGTSFLLITIVVSIFVFSLVFPWMPEFFAARWLNQIAYVLIKLPLLLPVAGLAYEATRLSARHPRSPVVRVFTWPGLMLQHITTREPDDSQLEIALVALRKTLWREALPGAEGRAAASIGSDVETFPSYEAFAASLPPAAEDGALGRAA
jgi:uncharacterized protein YqhQ